MLPAYVAKVPFIVSKLGSRGGPTVEMLGDEVVSEKRIPPQYLAA